MLLNDLSIFQDEQAKYPVVFHEVRWPVIGVAIPVANRPLVSGQRERWPSARYVPHREDLVHVGETADFVRLLPARCVCASRIRCAGTLGWRGNATGTRLVATLGPLGLLTIIEQLFYLGLSFVIRSELLFQRLCSCATPRHCSDQSRDAPKLRHGSHLHAPFGL